MSMISKIAILFGVLFLFNNNCFAGDGATILFREGHVAYLANGYATLESEYKKLSGTDLKHKIVELKLESSPFLINLAEVVLICRDQCSSLEVKDPRQTQTKK
jgi:hypothetical protein